MKKLSFEKIGDIHSSYPYLYVYFSGDREPFMEIAVSDTRELELTFYPHNANLVLTVQQLREIAEKAEIFLPQALENEDNSGMK